MVWKLQKSRRWRPDGSVNWESHTTWEPTWRPAIVYMATILTVENEDWRRGGLWYEMEFNWVEKAGVVRSDVPELRNLCHVTLDNDILHGTRLSLQFPTHLAPMNTWQRHHHHSCSHSIPCYCIHKLKKRCGNAHQIDYHSRIEARLPCYRQVLL